MRQLQFVATYDHELVVDGFAGGGGASTGIEMALGRSPDIAINHSATALAMHEANHPHTRHYCESIFDVDPVEVCAGRPVGLAWFSPDCTHFSRAKGSKPVDKNIRGLAWVAVRWAKAVRPRTILLENVEEFQTWGPLGDDCRPDPSRVGETFREWLAELTACGYSVEFRTLCAADFGAPTTRRRLFLIAQRDGERPIVWPEATHGKGRAHPWRAASEIIDWSLPTTSIFGRERPLAEATLQRIARGIERFVVDAKVEPFIVRHGHYSTITGAGLREGCGAGTFRGQSLCAPLATVCGTNDKHLVAPIITKHYGGVVGHDVRRTLGTVTGKDHHAVSAAFLTKYYGQGTGSALHVPCPTVTAGGDRGGGHIGLVRTFLEKYGTPGHASAQRVSDPLHTVTAKARFGLVTLHGEDFAIVDIGMRMLQPHELFAAQGFPPGYDITTGVGGKRLTKTEQTKLAGNSVCPDVARELVLANVVGAQRRAA